ncbi:MAG: glutathione S-transferase C-terminal domain-containing protein [Alphaproteobacteria bacterium]|nr:glutathione S-transferase C-terminal domain-containing protein [Alphaproteobacteria bacterium]
MITLFTYGPQFGLPDPSPFVTKTMVQLAMAGLDYETAPAMPTDSPKGQLPFINDDGVAVADSTFIRAYLEDRYGLDLDEGLSMLERAHAWAIERMVEDHLRGPMVAARWLIPENFERGPARWFDAAPAEHRDAMRAGLLEAIRANLVAQGAARHTADEQVNLGVRTFEALTAILGDKPFLFGDRPTGTDAVTFAMLAGILTPYFDSPLREAAERYPTLVAYTVRMMARFFPKQAWSAPLANAA